MCHYQVLLRSQVIVTARGTVATLRPSRDAYLRSVVLYCRRLAHVVLVITRTGTWVTGTGVRKSGIGGLKLGFSGNFHRIVFLGIFLGIL